MENPTTLQYAGTKAQKETSLRKKHTNRWRRRFLGGLASLLIAGAIGTNYKLQRKIEDLTETQYWTYELKSKNIPLWNVEMFSLKSLEGNLFIKSNNYNIYGGYDTINNELMFLYSQNTGYGRFSTLRSLINKRLKF